MVDGFNAGIDITDNSIESALGEGAIEDGGNGGNEAQSRGGERLLKPCHSFPAIPCHAVHANAMPAMPKCPMFISMLP